MIPLLVHILSLWSIVSAIDNLQVAFQWKKLDFDFATDAARQEAIISSEFLPENNVPVGLEVYEDRLFITVPRWRSGVAASLAYIHLSDPKESPKLHPYPNWSAHKLRKGASPPEIISPFRVRADSCGRLWVMDSGLINIMDPPSESLSPPRLLIYDLSNDQLLRTYTIPKDQYHPEDSFFPNVVVEENDCNDSFAYLADLGHPAMVVYSYGEDKSWMVKHHYFHLDPLAGDMTVGGENFQWQDGLFGMALSEQKDGFSSLYFHPMISYNEFNVSTKILRDEELIKKDTYFHDFNFLGSRGTKAQSGASFLHKKSKVLFYALPNLNAVACWRTTNPKYTITSQGRIFMSNETMVFPADIKVDYNNTLWVLSDKLPVFMYNYLNYEDYNFRILNSSVANAIRGTACDSKMVVNPDIVKTITNGTLNPSGGARAYLDVVCLAAVVCAVIFR